MSDLTDLLDEIRDRADRATGGPWSWASRVTVDGDSWAVFDGSDHALASNSDGWSADAEFIAHAREDVPRMVAALRGVLRQADALDELSASPIGASYAGALSLGARGIRHAITKALGAES